MMAIEFQQKVTRVALPSSPGRNSFRYWRGNKYIGEVELFAYGDEALQIIIKDLYEELTGIKLPVNGNGRG